MSGLKGRLYRSVRLGKVLCLLCLTFRDRENVPPGTVSKDQIDVKLKVNSSVYLFTAQ